MIPHIPVDENKHRFYGSKHARSETVISFLIVFMILGIIFLLVKFISGFAY